MSEIERIINEVNSSMAMEGLILTNEDKSRIESCLLNSESFDSLIESLINKHTVRVN